MKGLRRVTLQTSIYLSVYVLCLMSMSYVLCLCLMSMCFLVTHCMMTTRGRHHYLMPESILCILYAYSMCILRETKCQDEKPFFSVRNDTAFSCKSFKQKSRVSLMRYERHGSGSSISRTFPSQRLVCDFFLKKSYLGSICRMGRNEAGKARSPYFTIAIYS